MSHYHELLDLSLDDALNNILSPPNQHAKPMLSLYLLEQIAREILPSEIKSHMKTLPENKASI